MKICVLGTGYVGLVAGTCFAETGNHVICVDLNQEKIDGLNKGILPIYEPGLNDLVARNAKEGRLKFSTNSAKSIQDSDIIFIAVGTPSSTDGSADLAMFLKAAETIGENLNNYKIIVNKSTVPVGTAAKVEAVIRSKTSGTFDVVSNPEFLKEGTAIADFLKPDRVVIGAAKESVYKTMSELYAPFVLQGNPIIWMSNVSAEMTKYAANAFLAVKISFMNNVASLCEEVGADVESVRTGISSDQRIGRHFLYAGVGYGGSCFPKDVKALIKTGKNHEVDMRIVAAAEEVNEAQKEVLFTKMAKHFSENAKSSLKNKVICLWGLAFKPNTDDMREAPSLVIIEKLIQAGAQVQAYDPVAIAEAKRHLLHSPLAKEVDKSIRFVETPYGALEGADALCLVTEWSEFRSPDLNKIKQTLRSPVVFDGRNIYEPEHMRAKGFTYYSIGRP